MHGARSPGAAFTPVQSPGGTVTPRAPVVHFFVCDHGNAKVKAVTDQFISAMTANGVKVYTERYTTHQPGYQVRAASLNSLADFFFQIHSKTAGAGHVRLYTGGQPKRMSLDEAVSHVWAWWKLESGALTREEAEVLSAEKIAYLLHEFAGIEASIGELGVLLRNGDVTALEKLREVGASLVAGRARIASTRSMAVDWVKEPGGVLQRCTQLPQVRGLSAPLKDVLVAVIDESLAKVQRILEIAPRLLPPMEDDDVREEEEMGEIEIDVEPGRGDASGWKMMIESLDDDRMGSVQIASYGDIRHQSLDPMFTIDEY